MWPLLLTAAVLILVAVLTGLLIRRSNQLTLARDVCLEALRQLDSARRDRHDLIPELIDEAQVSPAMADSASRLAHVLTEAQDAREPDRVGPAEEAVTGAIDDMVLTFMDSAVMGSAAAVVVDLHAHLRHVETRLAASVRYYNQNVDRYCAMRRSPLAFPLRRVYPVLERMTYNANDLAEEPNDGDADDDPDYRPGSLPETAPGGSAGGAW